MRYKQALEDLIEEIEKYNAYKDLATELSPRDKINKILERLDTGEWRISINKAYGWDVATSKKYKIGDHGKLQIESFEEFKKTLTEAIGYYLAFVEIRKYRNLSDYREQGVKVALEIEKKINEDLYEDIMNELRRLKSNKSLRASSRDVTANINAYRSRLLDVVEGTALSWIEENLAPGMQVFPDTGRSGWTVEKVVRVGSNSLITLEGSKKVITDYEGVDLVKTWVFNAEEAKDIVDKAGYYSKGER